MAYYNVTTSNWDSPSFWSNMTTNASDDELDFSNLPSTFTIDLDMETGELSISDGTTTFTVGDSTASGSYDATLGGSHKFSEFESVYGSPGQDTQTGSNQDEELWGGDGNDSIDGGSGNDTIYFEGGDDTVRGGQGNDYIDDNDGWWDDDGRTEVYGGQGNDTVYASDGDDKLYGEDGDDRLYGEQGSDTLDGGTGGDRLSGGGGTDRFVFKDGYGNDTITDFNEGSEIVDVSSSGITSFSDIQSRLSDDGSGDAVLTLDDGSKLTFWDVSSSDLSASNFNITGPVCFSAGTLILTPEGERPVERLCVGDRVVTADNGPQALRWIGKQTFAFGPAPHDHKPILIKAGSLGPGRPRRDLRVSPQHSILLRGLRPSANPHPLEYLAPAKGLVRLNGVRQMHGARRVTYYSLLLDRHQILFAEGHPAESFYPAGEGLRLMGCKLRRQVENLYPAIISDPRDGYGPIARPRLTRRAAQQMIEAMSRPVRRQPDAMIGIF